MLITRTSAANILGISKQYMDELSSKTPRPLYFKKNKKGIYQIDDEHPAWLSTVDHYKDKHDRKALRQKEEKGLIKVPPAKVPHDFKKRAREAAEAALDAEMKGAADNLTVLNQKSLMADLEKKIYQNIIAREKSIQEEVRTLEIKKELIPLAMMKHWYSFAESMISRIGRRPGEIEAELEALFRGGEKQLATDKIKRELEAIVIEVHKELVEDIRKEGYKMPEKDEGGTNINKGDV